MPRPIPGTPEPAPAVDDGILLVDKPEGPTSHDVVARARRALRIRAIGHTGTLDPMATGLLPLVVGRATRLAQFLSHDKGYEACIRLGTTTDTWDRTGAVIAGPIDAARCPSQAEIEACLASFVGNHLQRPPSYSAKMIDGVRAHTLARRGATVDVPPVSVTLFSAELREIAPRRSCGSSCGARLATTSGLWLTSLVNDSAAALASTHSGVRSSGRSLSRTR